MARPTKRQQRIRQARELADNETLREIIASRELEIFERWKASDSTEQREICYHDYIALGELRDAIDATANADD